MSNFIIKLLNLGCIAVFCLLSFSTIGQTSPFLLNEQGPLRNSPYSIIALGDPSLQNYAHSLGSGGLGASFNDPYFVNLVNPASIGFLKSTSFEVGGFARVADLDAPNTSFNTYAGNFSYLSLGFPVKNQINIELDRKEPLVDWKMNFALTPYSDVGYTIISRSPFGETVDSPATDTITSTFVGSGGTYRVQWTNAVEYKNLSVGLDIGYFFGNIISERTAIFDNLSNAFSTNLIGQESFSGFIFKFGGLYNYTFGQEGEDVTRKLSMGAYITNQADITTKSSDFFRRISTVFGGSTGIDTIRNTESVNGEIVLPRELGIGFTYEKINKFRVGIDYSTSNMSNYTENGVNAGLNDSYRIAAGGEFIPNANSYNRFWSRVRYKAGISYRTDARSDQFNEQLTELGVTIGMTLPVILPRGQKSWFHFAITGGNFGTEESINETFVRANVGFTLNDNRWFYKRKFN